MGMHVWTDVWTDVRTDGWTNGTMDGMKDGRMDRPMDGWTDAWIGTGVALFGCGDGCLGLSGFSVCSSSSAGALTGGSPSGGISAPSPFCFCFGGGGLCAGRLGFVLGSSCFTASACLSGLSVDVALFNRGDGCLGRSGFSGSSSFSAGSTTGDVSPGDNSAPSFCLRFVTLGGGGLWAGRIGFVAGTCFTGSARPSVSSGFSTLPFSVSFDVVALGGGLDGFLSSILGIVASGDGVDCMKRCFTGGGLAGFTSPSAAIVASGGGVALCSSGDDCLGSFSLSAGTVVRGGEGVVIGIDGFLATGGLS